MQENLVIVESPAKAKKIEEFLGKDFKVMSSYGHIRDLKKKELSIDEKTMEPCYEIPEEKKKLVTELKSTAKQAKKIWLASDEDREGEAISWHLCEVLGLDEAKTSRIVFHEITKPAILDAIEHPRHLDMNLVNAQQARRVLDRIVGFKLSPVLWRKVKPALSAGRVQSVAVRLIVEREREVQKFKSEPYYRVNAVFALISENGAATEVKAELDHRFKTHEEMEAFLEKCKDAKFTVEAVTKKPLKRTPAPPFTTSTLQQEAARKLGFTVSQTMMVAQRLYEGGRITYMRTDSVNLSSLCSNASKDEIIKEYGKEYSKPRAYHTNSKGAQEAHEAIRPTYIEHIQGMNQEVGIEIEVRDAELIVHPDYFQARFFLYFSSHAFFTGFIHIYESAWQVEGAFGWLVFSANHQKFFFLVENEGYCGTAGIQIVGESAVLAFFTLEVVDLEMLRAANRAKLEFV
jgi:DNA topoisomerase I